MSNHHYISRNVSTALPGLLEAVLNGEEVGSRQGDRTMELTQVAIKLERPWEREVLTYGRRASLPAQIAETMWVLAGRNDVAWLSHYLPRAAEFSDDGQTWRGGYGPRLRGWRGKDQSDDTVDSVRADQLAHVVELMKKDRGTRRAVMAIYDPATDWSGGKDVPCNNWLSFISRLGVLEMHVATRSNDLFWGWSGINTFEWSALQEIMAGMLGIAPGPIHYSITSLHLYDRHWQKARNMVAMPSIYNEPRTNQSSPRFNPNALGPDRSVEELDRLIEAWFILEEALRSPHRESYRESVAAFSEPMLRSWLQVIGYHWSGDDGWLEPLEGTPLAFAARVSPKPAKDALDIKVPRAQEPEQENLFSLGEAEGPLADEPFIEFVSKLHAGKHMAYGDSWKKRGEMLGIMANIARKVDRLGETGGGDTAADTAIDLLVYLIKYRSWLQQDMRNQVRVVKEGLLELPAYRGLRAYDETIVESLRHLFTVLEGRVEDKTPARHRIEIVNSMIARAYPMAKVLWQQEQAAPKPDTAASEGAAIDAWERAHATCMNPECRQREERMQLTPEGEALAKRIVDGEDIGDALQDHTWERSGDAPDVVVSHAERNATRSWNPEAGLDEGYYEEVSDS